MPEPRAPGRRTPAKGVPLFPGPPPWVFLTVCTENRAPWLAVSSVHTTLREIWKNQATAWLVSDYVLMPDHLHLFCAPRDPKFTIERWIAFWKDCLTKTHVAPGVFQSGGFHHRLRDNESYAEKWHYAQENPVRHGLVARPEDWPFSGRVHHLHR